MLIFSSASSSLPWTSNLHQQDLGGRGKMLFLPLQVVPECLTQHSIHPAVIPTWSLVLQSEFEPFSSTVGLEVMGWIEWKEGSKQDRVVCPKTRGQSATRVPDLHPQAPEEPICPWGAGILPTATSLIWCSGVQILYGFQEVAMVMKCKPE